MINPENMSIQIIDKIQICMDENGTHGYLLISVDIKTLTQLLFSNLLQQAKRKYIHIISPFLETAIAKPCQLITSLWHHHQITMSKHVATSLPLCKWLRYRYVRLLSCTQSSLPYDVFVAVTSRVITCQALPNCPVWTRH